MSGLRIGYWLLSCFYAWGTANPTFIKDIGISEKMPKEEVYATPLSTLNSYRTADGQWVQLLGVDIGRFFMPMCKSVGIGRSIFPKIISSFVCKVAVGMLRVQTCGSGVCRGHRWRSSIFGSSNRISYYIIFVIMANVPLLGELSSR